MNAKIQEVKQKLSPAPKIIILKEGNEFFTGKSLQQMTSTIVNPLEQSVHAGIQIAFPRVSTKKQRPLRFDSGPFSLSRDTG